MQQDPSISPQHTITTPPDEPEVIGADVTSSGWRNVISTIAILVAAPVIAVALTAFVFQSYEVDGPSMEKTLQDRDRLIVWKLPRTISRITKNDYMPARGDVIIFVRHDLFDASGSEKQLIKRVIGLPGDRVVIKDGHFTVYNAENPNGFDPDTLHGFSGNIVKPTDGDREDVVVGEGEVYVSGDNRVNSLDSRTFGTIKSRDIVGKMVLRIYPFNGMKSFI